MPRIERIRELATDPVTQSMLDRRTASGWQLIALEWRREAPAGASQAEPQYVEEIPYGMRVASDCHHLEIDPAEQSTLVAMMELMVQDLPLSVVARRMNEQGYRTRDGALWSLVTVFEMVPRLIEVGPRLFSGEEWERRRKRFSRAG